MTDHPGDLRLRLPDGTIHTLSIRTRPKGWVLVASSAQVGGPPGRESEQAYPTLKEAELAMLWTAQDLTARLATEASQALPERAKPSSRLEELLADHEAREEAPEAPARTAPSMLYRFDEHGDLIEQKETD